MTIVALSKSTFKQLFEQSLVIFETTCRRNDNNDIETITKTRIGIKTNFVVCSWAKLEFSTKQAGQSPFQSVQYLFKPMMLQFSSQKQFFRNFPQNISYLWHLEAMKTTRMTKCKWSVPNSRATQFDHRPIQKPPRLSRWWGPMYSTHKPAAQPAEKTQPEYTSVCDLSCIQLLWVLSVLLLNTSASCDWNWDIYQPCWWPVMSGAVRFARTWAHCVITWYWSSAKHSEM